MIRTCILLIAVGCLSLAAVAQDKAVVQRLLDEQAEPVVVVRHVFKQQMSFMGTSHDQEQPSESFGVVVDPSGLVVCSNFTLEGFAGMMRRMRGMPGMGDDMEMSTTPVETKVIFAGDTVEYNADLVARDDERDLAWIRIRNDEGKTFPFVDMEQAGAAEIGDRVYSISRLSKYFDRAPVVYSTVIVGEIDIPRPLLVLEDEMRGQLGLPVYDAQTRPVGLLVVQGPSGDEMDPSMMSMMSGDPFMFMVMPAEEIVRAMALAKEMMPQEPAEETGEDEDEDEDDADEE